MITFIKSKRPTLTYRVLSAFIAFAFAFGIIIPPQMTYAQLMPATLLNLPAPGTMLPVSNGYVPALITGLTVHPENPLEFDFMVDTGDSGITGDQLEDESRKLIKYFLASLTVPEDELWVNLSPYEKDRIIPDVFGETEMGRDLLAQDYLLKQLTASLMYPENELGKRFWERVYQKAYDLYGTAEIPMNTFNKVWIVPDQAMVFEKDSSAYVIESRLKVMLEEDYVALKSNRENARFGMDQVLEEDTEIISGVTSEVVREVLIPEIEREVNEGETFANLRQIYNSMILATWYKQNLKESLLGRVYVDQGKIMGVDVEDKQVKQKIYDRYLEAFKTGVYNYIKEDYDPVRRELIPRKYFSGGFGFGNVRAISKNITLEGLFGAELTKEQFAAFLVRSQGITSEEYDRAILPVLQKFNWAEKKYIFDHVIIMREGDQVMFSTKVILVENADKNSNGIYVRRPDDKTSSPVQQDIQEVLAGMENELTYFRQKLGLSEVDEGYFKALYKKYLEKKENLRIAEDSFNPSAYLSGEERREKMAVTGNNEIEYDPQNKEIAKTVTLCILQMKGGFGTSFKRKRTLKRLKGTDSLADKATDSYFENIDIPGYDAQGNPIMVKDIASAAELRAQRVIYLQSGREKTYKNIIIEELVNDESQPFVEAFYNTPYVLDRADARRAQPRTYKQVIEETEGIELAEKMTVQGSYPNINVRTKKIIDNKEALAPGGHGFLGTLLLDRIAENAPAVGENVITTITNGDGVNNFPTPYLIGWMQRNRIPIVIISTTRTPLDTKGGVLGLEKVEGGFVDTATQIFEKAQAERANQFLDPDGSPGLFQKLGITEGEPGGQYFNTNISVYNETVLHPFLNRLKKLIGPEKFFEVTTPDLITNPKNKNINGESLEVFQLEGAKASALLNLNKFVSTTKDAGVRALMKEFGLSKLVHIENFDTEGRIDVFTPSKFSYDHAFYGKSTSFVVDVLRGRLELTQGVNPADLPSFDVDDFLKDLENDYEAFGEKFDAKELKSLRTRGEIIFPNAVLKGNLSMENLSGQRVDLNDHKDLFETTQDGRLVLDNKIVTITLDNNIAVKNYAVSAHSDGSSPVADRLTAIEAQLEELSLPRDQVRDGLEKFIDRLAKDKNVNSAEMTEVLKTLKDISKGMATIIGESGPALTKEDIRQVVLKRADLEENISILEEDIERKIASEKSSSPISAVQETRVVVIDGQGNKTPESYDRQNVVRGLQEILSYLENQKGRITIGIRSYSDPARYAIISAVSDTFGMWKDNHLSDNVGGTYWSVRAGNIDRFQEWLKKQLAVIEGETSVIRSVTLEPALALEDQNRIVVRGTSLDPAKVVTALKDIRDSLERQKGRERISLRSYGDTKYLILSAASDIFELGIDNHLSDRTNGTYWRVPTENVGQFAEWLDRQLSMANNVLGLPVENKNVSSPVQLRLADLLEKGVSHIGWTSPRFGEYNFVELPVEKPFQKNGAKLFYMDVFRLIDIMGMSPADQDRVLNYVHGKVSPEKFYDQWLDSFETATQRYGHVNGVYVQVKENAPWFLIGSYGAAGTERLLVLNLNTMKVVRDGLEFQSTLSWVIGINGERNQVEVIPYYVDPIQSPGLVKTVSLRDEKSGQGDITTSSPAEKEIEDILMQLKNSSLDETEIINALNRLNAKFDSLMTDPKISEKKLTPILIQFRDFQRFINSVGNYTDRQKKEIIETDLEGTIETLVEAIGDLTPSKEGGLLSEESSSPVGDHQVLFSDGKVRWVNKSETEYLNAQGSWKPIVVHSDGERIRIDGKWLWAPKKDSTQEVRFSDGKTRWVNESKTMYINAKGFWEPIIFNDDATSVLIDGKWIPATIWIPLEEKAEREASSPVGGIDLNPELLNLQIRRDGNGIPLPLFQQPVYNMNIEGFFPVIINITPVINTMPLLLGLLDDARDGNDPGYNPDREPMRKIEFYTLKDREDAAALN